MKKALSVIIVCVMLAGMVLPTAAAGCNHSYAAKDFAADCRNKARTVYTVLVVAVMALCVGTASLIGLAGGYVPLIACAAALAVGVIGLPVSAAVSLSVYKYKDF